MPLPEASDDDQALILGMRHQLCDDEFSVDYRVGPDADAYVAGRIADLRAAGMQRIAVWRRIPSDETLTLADEITLDETVRIDLEQAFTALVTQVRGQLATLLQCSPEEIAHSAEHLLDTAEPMPKTTFVLVVTVIGRDPPASGHATHFRLETEIVSAAERMRCVQSHIHKGDQVALVESADDLALAEELQSHVDLHRHAPTFGQLRTELRDELQQLRARLARERRAP